MGHIFWNEYYRLLDSGENVDVLAIGDSWFHYPANNLITPLHAALERPTIYVIGENGARADELATGSWRANFDKMVLGLTPSCTTASRSGTSTVPGPPAGPVMTRPSMPTFMVMTPAVTRHSRAVRMIVA